MPFPAMSNRQRHDESFRRSQENFLNAIATMKAAKDQQKLEARQAIADAQNATAAANADALAKQGIAKNTLALDQAKAEQGLVTQFTDSLTMDQPGMVGPQQVGLQDMGDPLTAKGMAAQKDRFKYDVVAKLRTVRGKETTPDQVRQEFEAEAAKNADTIAAAQAAPGLRQVNLQTAQANLGRIGVENRETEARIGKINAEAVAEGQPNKGKPPTADQAKVATYGHRVEQSMAEMDRLIEGGFDRAAFESGAKSKLPSMIQPKEIQQQAQAERNFVNAVLRRESGAVISDQEFANAERQYFPRSGDSKEVKAQKERNRQQALAGFKAEAGTAWGNVETIRPPADAAAGFTDDKKRRLEELRAKRAAGTLANN